MTYIKKSRMVKHFASPNPYQYKTSTTNYEAT